MDRKSMISENLMETSEASRFNLVSREDFSFRHTSCLQLRNMITDDKMKLIWRKKLLEVIPNDVNRQILIDLIQLCLSHSRSGCTDW